jgi:hypothetical protein
MISSAAIMGVASIFRKFWLIYRNFLSAGINWNFNS